MTWLAWRQLRAQTGLVLAAVAGVSALLLANGPGLHRAARGQVNVLDLLSHFDRDLFYVGIVVLAIVPALIGAFWGAPLIAREMEGGTLALVWNQSITRRRWLTVRLGAVLLAAALAVGALTLVVTWWAGPADGAMSATTGSLPSRMTPISFGMRGLVPVAYTLFAVALGVALGLVLRRSLPAMALTLAVVAFVQVAMPLWVRPHLMAPVSQSVTATSDNIGEFVLDAGTGHVTLVAKTPSHDDWVISHATLDPRGRVAALPSYIATCIPVGPDPGSKVESPDPVQEHASIDACLARLAADGYRQRVTFQPADRFWALQWRELGLFLVLTGLLSGFCFWRIRRV